MLQAVLACSSSVSWMVPALHDYRLWPSSCNGPSENGAWRWVSCAGQALLQWRRFTELQVQRRHALLMVLVAADGRSRHQLAAKAVAAWKEAVLSSLKVLHPQSLPGPRACKRLILERRISISAASHSGMT